MLFCFSVYINIVRLVNFSQVAYLNQVVYEEDIFMSVEIALPSSAKHNNLFNGEYQWVIFIKTIPVYTFRVLNHSDHTLCGMLK